MRKNFLKLVLALSLAAVLSGCGGGGAAGGGNWDQLNWNQNNWA